jgi:hypothetical protein
MVRRGTVRSLSIGVSEFRLGLMFSSSVYSMCGEDWDGGEWLDESVLERLAWWIGPRLNARPGDATGAGALGARPRNGLVSRTRDAVRWRA